MNKEMYVRTGHCEQHICRIRDSVLNEGVCGPVNNAYQSPCNLAQTSDQLYHARDAECLSIQTTFRGKIFDYLSRERS